jgi:hypothetical protein
MSDGFQFGLGALIASVVFCSIIAAIVAGIAGVIQGVPVNLSLAAGGPFDACIKNGFSAGAVVGLLAYLTATAYAGFAESTRPNPESLWTAIKVFAFVMIFGAIGSGVIIASVTIQKGGTHWLNWF